MRRVRRLAFLATLMALVTVARPASASVEHSDHYAAAIGTSSGFTKATARLRVPSFTCPATGQSGLLQMAQWGTGDNSVEGALTVALLCNNGQPSVSAYVFATGAPVAGQPGFTNVAIGD